MMVWLQFAFPATAVCPFAHLPPVPSCVLSASPDRDMSVCLFKGGQTHPEKGTDTGKVDSETWDADAKRLLKTFILHQ